MGGAQFSTGTKVVFHAGAFTPDSRRKHLLDAVVKPFDLFLR
jgi:hypothetical protein